MSASTTSASSRKVGVKKKTSAEARRRAVAKQRADTLRRSKAKRQKQLAEKREPPPTLEQQLATRVGIEKKRKQEQELQQEKQQLVATLEQLVDPTDLQTKISQIPSSDNIVGGPIVIGGGKRLNIVKDAIAILLNTAAMLLHMEMGISRNDVDKTGFLQRLSDKMIASIDLAIKNQGWGAISAQTSNVHTLASITTGDQEKARRMLVVGIFARVVAWTSILVLSMRDYDRLRDIPEIRTAYLEDMFKVIDQASAKTFEDERTALGPRRALSKEDYERTYPPCQFLNQTTCAHVGDPCQWIYEEDRCHSTSETPLGDRGQEPTLQFQAEMKELALQHQEWLQWFVDTIGTLSKKLRLKSVASLTKDNAHRLAKQTLQGIFKLALIASPLIGPYLIPGSSPLFSLPASYAAHITASSWIRDILSKHDDKRPLLRSFEPSDISRVPGSILTGVLQRKRKTD